MAFRGPASPKDADEMSITSQVTKVVEGLPATDLIKVLLRHIAVDVAQFRRNVQSWNQVYYRSRLVYDSIQVLMQQIDSADEAAEVMALWEAFQRYTAAIIPLEKILLKFHSNYRPEHQRQLLPPTDGIDSTIIYIETWKIDRQELGTTFVTFSRDDNFLALSESIQKDLVDNYNVHRASDDMQTLRALVESFAAMKLTDKDIIQRRNQRLVTAVKTSLRLIIQKVSQFPSTHTSTEIVLQILLLIYIPFAYLSVQTTSVEWREYYASTIIWEALQKSTKLVEDHLQPNSTITVEALEKEWEELKKLLLKLTEVAVDTAEEILDLLKLAAHIRGPLRARSVELVKMLFHLNHFSKDAKNNALRYRPDLKKLFIESIATLEEAKGAVADIKKFTLDSAEYQKQDSSVKTIVSKIASSYTTVGLGSEWSAREALFSEAVKIDQDHLKLMRERLGLN